MGRISLVVAPGARRSEVIGPHGGAWKVRIASSPERGRANEELRSLLAGALGVARDDVQVVSGHASRRKVVEVAALVDRDGPRLGCRAGLCRRRDR